MGDKSLEAGRKIRDILRYVAAAGGRREMGGIEGEDGEIDEAVENISRRWERRAC